MLVPHINSRLVGYPESDQVIVRTLAEALEAR